jgi:hypothetical protein
VIVDDNEVEFAGIVLLYERLDRTGDGFRFVTRRNDSDDLRPCGERDGRNGVVIECTQLPEGSPKKCQNNPDQEGDSREGHENRRREGHQGAPEVAGHQNTRSSGHKQIPRAPDDGLRQDGIGGAGIVLSDIIIFLMVAGLLGGLI